MSFTPRMQLQSLKGFYTANVMLQTKHPKPLSSAKPVHHSKKIRVFVCLYFFNQDKSNLVLPILRKTDYTRTCNIGNYILATSTTFKNSSKAGNYNTKHSREAITKEKTQKVLQRKGASTSFAAFCLKFLLYQ